MDFEFEVAPPPPPRSTFVNVLAWIFIVLGGFATFISILQNIMIQLMFPKEEMTRALQHAEQSDQLPAVFNVMFRHFDLFFLVFLVIAAATLVAAIGLLKRKNWARIAFIILMAAGILYNIGGLLLQFTMFESMPQMTEGQMPPEFATMMTIMKFASVVMVLAFSALFGWIIIKLLSAPIRAEFT